MISYVQGQEQAAVFFCLPLPRWGYCDSNFAMSKPFFYFLVKKYSVMGIVSSLVYLSFEINDDNLVLNQRLFVHFPFNMCLLSVIPVLKWKSNIGPYRLEGLVTPRSVE